MGRDCPPTRYGSQARTTVSSIASPGPTSYFPLVSNSKSSRACMWVTRIFSVAAAARKGAVEGFPSRGHGPAAQPPPPTTVPPPVAGPPADAAPASGRGASGGRGGRGRGGGGGAGVTREGDFDHPTDWNVVEVVMRGNQSVHIVNGTVVATITNLQRPGPAETRAVCCRSHEARLECSCTTRRSLSVGLRSSLSDVRGCWPLPAANAHMASECNRAE